MKRTPLARRTPLKRAAPPKRARPRPRDIVAAAAFREAARAQGRCQNPDCPDPHAVWSAHHAVFRQHLARAGADVYDPRAAVRLCVGCHADYHARTLRLDPDALPVGVRELAAELFGPDGAQAYIDRYYPSR